MTTLVTSLAPEDRANYFAAASNAAWELWATIDSGKLPPDSVDAMQVTLVRWQQANFGSVSPTTHINEHMGLGVIEEFCELVTSPEPYGNKGKLDGLGDLCVYTGQLLNFNRMAIRPIMEFADILADEWLEEDGHDWQSERLIQRFNHIVLKHVQKIRGFDKLEIWRPALTEALAKLLAHGKLEALGWISTPDGYWTDDDLKGHPAPKSDGLIQRTYIQVASEVVLKRDWVKDPVNAHLR